MKKLVYLLMLFTIFSCSSNKITYWCGDHACASKDEKESYFKKTMIVEMKNLENNNEENNLKLEKIIQQSDIKKKIKVKKEKKLSKQLKFEEKQKKKKEKSLLKQAKLDAKKRLKEEKILAKQIKLEEKRRKKEEKKLTKLYKNNEKKILKNKKKVKTKKINDENLSELTYKHSNNFEKLAESIITKNAFKPYPDINEIPN